ncbi:MAG: S24/S26 family peptidase [Candidatus Acidiferrales bacterium]|jgi:signal peptidase I
MVQETDARLAERTAKHVARGGRVCLRVHGVSMLPWVRPRDIVVVRGTQLEAIRCGDLVLFARHGRLFVHRVVEKRDLAWNSHLLAKGDSHPKPDDPIHAEELLGRVVRIHRGKRRIDLDTPWESFKSSLITFISGRGGSWYPVGKLAAMTMSPIRRLAAFFE